MLCESAAAPAHNAAMRPLLILLTGLALPAFAQTSPETVVPARTPPSTSGPNVKPTRTGVIKAIAPGRIISRIDARVEISTHFSYCGWALYSIMPGISRN